MHTQKHGFVYLVGAGPGDPDLITVRGLKTLQSADVVVYDRLVNPHLLAEIPAHATTIYVGKQPGPRVAGSSLHTGQREIEQILIREARRGKRVVRLKGGDPFVFGRGGEECQALAAAGVAYEVVPGISSALAAPAYAGIPVTQRHMATSFTVVTGHTAGADDCAVDWQRLPLDGTLVILMGVRNLPHIAQQLLLHGRDADTPVAIVQQGTTAQQSVVGGTLGSIAAQAAAANVRAPAVIVVGEVAALHQELNWFSPQQASDLLSDFLPGVQAHAPGEPTTAFDRSPYRLLQHEPVE